MDEYVGGWFGVYGFILNILWIFHFSFLSNHKCVERIQGEKNTGIGGDYLLLSIADKNKIPVALVLQGFFL